MDETKQNETSGRSSSNNTLKRVGIYAAVLLGVFLLGLIPMWLTARARADERDAARANLRLSQMQNRLASAAIDARRGEYEPARAAASEFFTSLRAEVDQGQETSLSQQQRENFRPLLAQRDEVITLLARNDPASVDRLTDLYVAYRQTIDGAR